MFANEIESLEARHCSCADWSKISVSGSFNVEGIRDCAFEGEVVLGRCMLSRSLVSNVVIEDGAQVDNVGCIGCCRHTAFGEGMEIAVLDETGSRSVRMFSGMTAQLCHLLAFWRKDVKALSRIDELIDARVRECQSDKSYVGRNVVIRDCQTLQDVFIHDGCQLIGVSLIKNATLHSKCFVGYGVIARDVILQSGARLTDQAQVNRCFVGYHSAIGEQFAATDCIIFSNCQLFHGEGEALLAGPFAVSHHKATLLIAASLSFFNAGSSSNESNHMYKSGPIHYGVLDRGTKMASGSYIPWPSRTGCFSLIMNKVENKVDTSFLPFSYIIGEGRNVAIVPAIALRNLGTYRDENKWRTRDCRTAEQQSDFINFDLLNPYTVSQIVKGRDYLKERLQQAGERLQVKDNVFVSRGAAQRGARLYEMAIDIYLGRLQYSKKEMQYCNTERWTDLCGMIAPVARAEQLVRDIESGVLDSLDKIQKSFEAINEQYDIDEQQYMASLTVETDIAVLKKRAEEAQKEIDRLVEEDRLKEFSDEFKTNFGVNQGGEAQEEEFNLLRKE